MEFKIMDTAEWAVPILSITDHVMLDNGEKSVFVKLKDIHKITTDEEGGKGNYSIFHFKDKTFCALVSLARVMRRLDKRHFIRTDRKTIINVNFIEDLSSDKDGTWIKLKYGNKIEEIITSRRQGQAFREQFLLRFNRF